MYRIRDYLDHDTIKQVYLSLAYPHLLYCCAQWGGTFSTYTDSLFVEQKKLLRIMFHRQSYDHTHPLFTSYNLLKLNDITRIYLQTCLFVHSALYSSPVDWNFHLMDHSSTRSYNNLRLPLCRTSHAQLNILFRGPKLWNQLPQDIKRETSRPTFKRKLKKNMLLNNYS